MLLIRQNLKRILQKKTCCLAGGSSSIGGRIILINSSLSNSTIYHMPMFLLSKTVLYRMDKGRRQIFWQGSKMRKAYYLVKWKKICRFKGKSGLSIKDLWKINISLLCKWWWVLENGE
jgi:hypothetical protein